MGTGTDAGGQVMTDRPPTTVPATPDRQSDAAASVLLVRPDVQAARLSAQASRTAFDEELERLEAAVRAALDVKAKIRRNPARVAGAAAGIGFLAVGGPRRVLRGARYAVFGRPDPLPKAMLPEEIEKALRGLGDDGTKVRGALERNFAAYLEQNAPERKGRSRRDTLLFILLPLTRVLVLRFGRQFIDEVLATRGGFDDQLAKVRARRAESKVDPPAGE
jgi:hypothetical protein